MPNHVLKNHTFFIVTNQMDMELSCTLNDENICGKSREAFHKINQCITWKGFDYRIIVENPIFNEFIGHIILQFKK